MTTRVLTPPLCDNRNIGRYCHTSSVALEDIGEDGRVRETGWEGVDWINLVQDRDQWRGLVNTVMNLLVP
jgi:hypothetical protein